MTTPAVPIRHLPESVMIEMLKARYGQVSMGAHRYAVAAQVPQVGFGALRICDFMALDCWQGRDIYPLHGFEIKGSRGDWLAELRDPSKAETFKQFCHRWWLVVSDPRIVREGELPEGWGLLAVAGNRGLRQVRPAAKLKPEPMPWPMLAAFTRAVAKTARRPVATG
jgi:hypothetical protein